MKNILLLTYDNCDDSEVMYPLLRVKEEGWNITVASFEKKLIHAKYHFTVDATHLFSEINPDDYDGLILPGGTAPEKIRLKPEALSICRHFMEKGKPVAAICHGVQILISAKTLQGLRCTCYPGISDDVINAGGLYEDKEVVVDRNLVTSRRPDDLPAFMREFVGIMKK